MPALDFTEIAPAHEGAQRDQFELFARDVLEAFGFEILKGPDRGPDAGRDLIVRERRTGVGGTTILDWLVSCKHKAHSGNAVFESDDRNLRDRIETHNCQGIIAFYSTVPSSTLATHFTSLEQKYPVLILDAERIESQLLGEPKGRVVAARYFPRSYPKWIAGSQYAQTPTPPRPLPITDRFFMRAPHTNLAEAKAEAEARGVPVFAVAYDPDHSSRSQLDYCLGYFMGWETTKRLVDQHFVAAVGPISDPDFRHIVPEDDPLEECRLVILDGNVTIRSESVYANSGEGRRRVLSAIESAKSNRKDKL